MQSHDTDLLVNPESHQAPARRSQEADSSGAEALIHARTDALTPSAVMQLQKTAGNASVTAALEEQEPSPVKDVVGSGSGSPLDRDTRGFMESRLAADFGDVRIHTDARAHESAKSVQAYAYTVGNDVVFQSGKYEPQSESGRRMLAHELTHVVQQRSGPVDGTPAAGGIQVSDPSDRFERAADASADRVMSSSGLDSTATAPPPSIQRVEDDSDVEDEDTTSPPGPTTQRMFVQRADDELTDEG